MACHQLSLTLTLSHSLSLSLSPLVPPGLGLSVKHSWALTVLSLVHGLRRLLETVLRGLMRTYMLLYPLLVVSTYCVSCAVKKTAPAVLALIGVSRGERERELCVREGYLFFILIVLSLPVSPSLVSLQLALTTSSTYCHHPHLRSLSS